MILSLFFLGLLLCLVKFLDLIGLFYLNFIPYFCVGGFLTIFNIQFFSLAQSETDSKYIGRVYSCIFTITLLFMPLGNIAFGLCLPTSSLIGMFIAGTGIVFSTIVYFFIK